MSLSVGDRQRELLDRLSPEERDDALRGSQDPDLKLPGTVTKALADFGLSRTFQDVQPLT